MAVSPDGAWIAVGFSSGIVSLIDLNTGVMQGTWKAHDSEILQVALRLIECMIGLRQRQGNLRQVCRLFSAMQGLPSIRLNNLKLSLRFPCYGLNSIIDYLSHPFYS